jgi:hypothetical protein
MSSAGAAAAAGTGLSLVIEQPASASARGRASDLERFLIRPALAAAAAGGKDQRAPPEWAD